LGLDIYPFWQGLPSNLASKLLISRGFKKHLHLQYHERAAVCNFSASNPYFPRGVGLGVASHLSYLMTPSEKAS
jgi:hypothetical protein